MISGFYMQMVLSEKYTYNRIGKNYVIKFYFSRYTRLMPMYLLCLVSTAAYLYVSRHTFDIIEFPNSPVPVIERIVDLSDSKRNILFKMYFFFTSIFLFFQDLVLNVYVLNGQANISLLRTAGNIYIPQGMLIPQAWSLGVELSFYLAAPFLLKLKNRYMIYAFLGLFALKFFPIILGPASDLYFRSLPFVLCYFLLGAIAYRYRDYLNVFNNERINIIQLLHLYVFVIGVSLLIKSSEIPYSFIVVIICGLYLPSIFHVTKNIKIDRWIGETSYPIYIFHMFFYMVMANNWKSFEWLAISLVMDHVKLIALLTLVSTIVMSFVFSFFEMRYVNPVRHRLFEK